MRRLALALTVTSLALSGSADAIVGGPFDNDSFTQFGGQGTYQATVRGRASDAPLDAGFSSDSADTATSSTDLETTQQTTTTTQIIDNITGVTSPDTTTTTTSTTTTSTDQTTENSSLSDQGSGVNPENITARFDSIVGTMIFGGGANFEGNGRSLIFYRGITFRGLVQGIVDMPGRSITGSIVGQREIIQDSATGTGTGDDGTDDSNSTSNNVEIINSDGYFDATIVQRAPTLRFEGEGVLTLFSGLNVSSIIPSATGDPTILIEALPTIVASSSFEVTGLRTSFFPPQLFSLIPGNPIPFDINNPEAALEVAEAEATDDG